MNRTQRRAVALLLALAAMASLTSPATWAVDGQPLTFDARSLGGPNSGAPLELWHPAGAGPFPAVLVLHTCDGVGANTRAWAARLTGWGYVAAIVDSFRPRNVKQVCDGSGVPTPPLRAQDVYNAATFLRTLPDIVPDRIGAVGFSHGGRTVLSVIEPDAVPADRGGRPFQAAVAYYPGCSTNPPQVAAVTDVLILIGKDDDWASAARCEKYVAAKAGLPHAPVLKVYPGAVHAFDNAGSLRLAHDHMIGNNPEAAADSFKMTEAFLAERLKGK
jgi:dienelactone hydrolase